ncbi:alpha/beta hydrolase [Bacillus sp. BGMRC 2118]|nr:alpha/beta hydrolase [Bacillus sp. BGMRC 2118]
MTLAGIARNTLGIIMFPFTIWNVTQNKRNKVLPPGKIVRTNQSDIHVLVTGEGPVTVILEAGYSSTSIDWCYVQPELSTFARVLSYDRGNYGWSKTKRKTMSTLDHVEELREVLHKLDIKPPYVLVGHSYGGLSMRLFASMYPDEVSGLVLEDAAHENYYVMSNENKKRIQTFKRLVTMGYVTSLMGLPRLLKQKVGRKFLSAKYNDSLNYTGYTLGAYQAAYREYRDSSLSAKQLFESRSLNKNLPVVVISAKNDSLQWNEHQQLLAKLTNQTTHIQAQTGHSVHLEDPELVINSILKLVNNHSKIKTL